MVEGRGEGRGRLLQSYHGVATELLRRVDGWADLIFVLSYTAFVIIFRQILLAPFMPWIFAIGLYKGVSTIHDFSRYGRGSAFHFWSAKLWALPYYLLLFELIIHHQPLWAFWPAIRAYCENARSK